MKENSIGWKQGIGDINSKPQEKTEFWFKKKYTHTHLEKTVWL